MLHGIYEALSGGVAQARRLEVLTNNLANASTAGFRRDVVVFRELPSRTPVSVTAGGGMPIRSFVGVAGTFTDWEGGAVRETGNPLDVALVGDGFFTVDTPQGIRYTRRGDFRIDANGQLVTREGHPVLGEGGPISLQDLVDLGGKVEISTEGRVVLVDPVTRTETEVDRLRLVRFTDPGVLRKEGPYFRLPPGAAGVLPAEDVQVQQGALESSNVNPVQEMVGMLEALRAFEAYQRMIRAMDEMNQRAVNELGRVSA